MELCLTKTHTSRDIQSNGQIFFPLCPFFCFVFCYKYIRYLLRRSESTLELGLGIIMIQGLPELHGPFEFLRYDQILKSFSRPGTSLVAQWLGIRLPMQGTWIWSLVLEDPTCHGATKPVCHNYRACTLEPASHNYWAHMPQLLKLTCLEPVLCNKRSHRNEKPAHRSEE